jgi:hypothetical protein
VSNFRWLRAAGIVMVCWIVTAGESGWAEPAHVDWVEDPYAPHVTNGSTVRLGTAVGFLRDVPIHTLAIGASAGFGQRWGRLAIESELDVLSLRKQDESDTALGRGERLNALARVDVIRIGPEYVGGNSLLSIYVEGGAGVAWNQWSKPGLNEPARVVPTNTERTEGQVGFGIALDHRLQEPIGFPHRVGWFLGWRLALASDPGTPTACRGCQSADANTVTPPATSSRVVLRAMLFQSSLNMTW